MPTDNFLQKNYPYLLLIIAPLLWAGNFVMGRLMNGAIPPFTFSFLRWLLVSIVLLPFVAKELLQRRQDIFKHGLFLILLSFLGVVIYTAFVYWSLNYTNVINASLINASIPAIILIISRIFFHGTISTRQVIGIIASIIGVVFIITRADLQILLHLGIDRGEVIMLFAVLAWALYSILLNYTPIKLSPFLFLFMIATIGWIILLPMFCLEYFNNQVMIVNVKTVSALLYTVLIASVLAYTCWSIGVNKISAGRAGPFYNLLAVFGALLAILFLGEPFHSYHVVGICFVFIGIYLATFKAKGKHYCPSGCPNKHNFEHVKKVD